MTPQRRSLQKDCTESSFQKREAATTAREAAATDTTVKETDIATKKGISATATRKAASTSAAMVKETDIATKKGTNVIATKSSQPRKMKTAVVILNWNTRGYLEKFVPGILRSIGGDDACLVVADSASTDGSMQMLSEKFPEVRQIRLDKNYGFTGGYNRALSQIDAEYIVLLNSDIEVPVNWLRPLTLAMDTHPEIGACAPKLHSWYDRDMFEYAGAAGGYLYSFGFPFCRGHIMKMVEKDTGQYDTPADVLWATGACLMVRSAIFRMLGGLDDRFFAHMEEIDLCWRIQLAGYKVSIIPDSVAYHIGGGTLPQTSPWKLKLNYRNNLMLLENNLAKTYSLRILRKSLRKKLKSVSGMESRLEQGDIPEEYFSGIDIEKIAGRASRKARKRIFWRMVIDGCTGIAYLATFKWSSFMAVIQAHSEFRSQSRAHSHSDGEVNAFLAGIINASGDPRKRKVLPRSGKLPAVKGLYPHWIIPRALFLRRRAFGSVRRYFSEHVETDI